MFASEWCGIRLGYNEHYVLKPTESNPPKKKAGSFDFHQPPVINHNYSPVCIVLVWNWHDPCPCCNVPVCMTSLLFFHLPWNLPLLGSLLFLMKGVHSLASWKKKKLCVCASVCEAGLTLVHLFVSIFSLRSSFLRVIFYRNTRDAVIHVFLKCKLNSLAFSFSPAAKFTPQQQTHFARNLWGHSLPTQLLLSVFLSTLCHCENTWLLCRG